LFDCWAHEQFPVPSVLTLKARARVGGALGCARLASDIDTAFFCQGNAGGLMLSAVLQFDFGDAEEQAAVLCLRSAPADLDIISPLR
jgi:hypothetical protein